MRKYIGLGLWWLFLVVATLIVERALDAVPLSALIGIAIVLGIAAIPLMFSVSMRRRLFDMPIQEAVDHYVRTFPHSYRDGADQHAFEVLHKAMCGGKLPVVGSRGEDAPPKRISARRCKRLKPIRTLLPKNRASPQGVRFDLMESVEATEPLEENTDFLGYTGLRVRSSDLYRLWPKDLSGND